VNPGKDPFSREKLTWGGKKKSARFLRLKKGKGNILEGPITIFGDLFLIWREYLNDPKGKRERKNRIEGGLFVQALE